MPVTFSERLVAYLVLLSGLAISAVAEYYSIMGLIAIYPAAVIPIVIMGVVLGFGKISATIWLKQNWQYAPWWLKTYILPAIISLMVITSLGVFGFLSKAHSDQSLVSGDAQAKIAVYDEKIRTAKDNIDANRKALKQMDEAVDQVMGRSTDEKGADKAVKIRRAQQKERVRLQSEIATEQKAIAAISEERAPIAAEVRKIEAEVGPIKYIAHLLYGENPDANILEKAVIWVTVLIVIVLDPLAVILLLASQYSFQSFRERDSKLPGGVIMDSSGTIIGVQVPKSETPAPAVAEVVEKPIEEELSPEAKEVLEEMDLLEQIVAERNQSVASTSTTDTTATILSSHPYLNKPFTHFTDLKPLVARIEEPVPPPSEALEHWNQMIAEAEKAVATEEPKTAVIDMELIDALESAVTRLQDENTSLEQEVAELRKSNLTAKIEKYGYTSEGGVVRIAGEQIPEEEFKNILKGVLYVQNEEQDQSGLWKKITEEQYIEQARKKNDNTDNAT
jgi:cell division protein FtsB